MNNTTNQPRFTSQPPPRPSLLPRPRNAAISAIAITIAFLLDTTTYNHLAITDPSRLALIESKDWYRTLRIAGYLGTWLIIAALFWTIDAAALRNKNHNHHQPQPNPNTPDGWWRRGIFPIAAALLAGAAAEALKPLIGRYRPNATPTNADPIEGSHVFAPLAERFTAFSQNDLGMASSHAAVAFAAAAAVGLMLPPARPVLYALAAGCAMTRIIAGAHFLSDTTVAAILGVASAHILWKLDTKGRYQRQQAKLTTTQNPPRTQAQTPE